MKRSIFIKKMRYVSRGIEEHISTARKLFGNGCRVLFKVSHDTEKELATVIRHSHVLVGDELYNDIYINSVAADIVRYSLLNPDSYIVYLYNRRAKTLSINLLIP